MSVTEKNAIALGTFDGLHRGHAEVLSLTLQSGLNPCALLFDTHPAAVLRGAAPSSLITEKKRDALLAEQGITPLRICFSDIASLSAEAFFSDVLLQKLNAGALCCGENYTFGKNRSGNKSVLAALCKASGIPLYVAPTVDYEGAPVSSTRIRTALQAGEIEKANAMLGRPFSYAFPVVSGDRRGRLLHFPTINQFFPEGFIQPKYGVYASRVFVEGHYHAAVTNFGVRPTIGTESVRSETCILGFSGDLYGTETEVELLSYLREEQKFASLEELQEAISHDSRRAVAIFENTLAKQQETM